MPPRLVAASASVLLLLSSLPSRALCIYKGRMSAKTTLAEEFSDSKWVVRAKVLAADDHWSDEDESWTIYHLQVLTPYKGAPPRVLDLFTFRDSGGFYLDRGSKHDLGGEYLLFLDAISSPAEVPEAVRGATEVNYSCGQSRAWTSVSVAARDETRRLSRADGGGRAVHH